MPVKRGDCDDCSYSDELCLQIVRNPVMSRCVRVSVRLVEYSDYYDVLDANQVSNSVYPRDAGSDGGLAWGAVLHGMRSIWFNFSGMYTLVTRRDK